MGKARPRVTKFGTFMPKEYEAWREIVRWQVRSQIPTDVLHLLPLTGRLSWSATYSVPKGKMGPDGDNADGALWDAIQTPPIRRSKNGKIRGGGWGLIANDKQFKRWGGSIVSGPSFIRFTIEEIP
jgi:hypothetical protein